MRIKPVEFHRTKYGPELLIDVAWVHDMPTFITDVPHVLAFFDIMLVTRGRGTLTLGGARHTVKPGAVFFTAPGKIRDWNVEGLDGVCLFFPASFLDEFFADAAFLERLPYFGKAAPTSVLYLGPRRTARLTARLASMRRELRSLRGDSADLLRAKLYEILVMLSRYYGARRGRTRRPSGNPIVEHYRALIEREAPDHHDVAYYAKKLGVTAGHLNALCKQTTNATAKALIADSLSLRARRLLRHSDQTIAEIARSLGFDDPSYFTRFFRRVTGRAPSTFRSRS